MLFDVLELDLTSSLLNLNSFLTALYNKLGPLRPLYFFLCVLFAMFLLPSKSLSLM